MLTTVSNYRCNVGFIFLGGCGCNQCNRFLHKVNPGDNPDVSIFAGNTDAKQLKKFFGGKKAEDLNGWSLPRLDGIQFGETVTMGKGAGANPERGEKALSTDGKAIEALNEFISGKNIVIPVGGLGGGTGTSALPLVAKLCVNTNRSLPEELQKTVIAVVVMPRTAENRDARAKEALAKMIGLVPTIVLKNSLIKDYLAAITDEDERRKISMNDVWRKVDDDGLMPTLEILNEITTKTGETVHSDENDLNTILKGGNNVFIGLAKIAPDEADSIRASQVLERLFQARFQNTDVARSGKRVGLFYKGWAPAVEVEELETLVRKEATLHNPKLSESLEIISGYRLEGVGDDRWVAMVVATDDVRPARAVSEKAEQGVSAPVKGAWGGLGPSSDVSDEFKFDLDKLSAEPVHSSAANGKAVVEEAKSTFFDFGLSKLRRGAPKRTPIEFATEKSREHGETVTMGVPHPLASRYLAMKADPAAYSKDDWRELREAIKEATSETPVFEEFESLARESSTH